MRRVSFVLAVILPMMGSSGFAADTPGTDSNAAQQVQKPTAAAPARHPTNHKRVYGTPSDGRTVPRSLPLPSAAAYAAEPSANLPITSGPRPASPSGNSWTGFYLGAGVGVGR